MSLREAAQRALETMDDLHRTGDTQVFDMIGREATELLRAALAAENRICTCHPDDNPPKPCQRKYALTECQEAALAKNVPETNFGNMAQVVDSIKADHIADADKMVKQTPPIAWYDPSNGVVSTDKNDTRFTPLGQLWQLYRSADTGQAADVPEIGFGNMAQVVDSIRADLFAEASKMVKTWQQRCKTHPDHQQGMVTNQMIMDRMQEEIDELRAVVSQQMTTDGPQPKGGGNLPPPFMEKFDSFVFLSLTQPRAWVEVTKKEYEKLPDNQRLLGLSSEATVKESLTVEATCKEILQVQPVVEFRGRRSTPERTSECWGILLCDFMQDPPKGTKLYAAPPKREPLTDAHLTALCRVHWDRQANILDHIAYARAIERAHGIGGKK